MEGTLIERTFYGPPGFGESPATDVRDTVLVLRLANSITVVPTADAEARNSPNLEPVSGVRQVQLFCVGKRAAEAQARKLLGKVVIAEGSLDAAVAPRQYTKVTMDVKSISLR